jgi:hypothetical protein
MAKSPRDLQEAALKVCVVALLVAILGFALAFLGYMDLGWGIGGLAAAANVVSMVVFFVLKLRDRKEN